MKTQDAFEKIRILGAIGLCCAGNTEPVERVMRMENFVPVEPAKLPTGYPFAEYEKCEVMWLSNKAPFTDILIFQRFSRVFERAIELSRVIGDYVFAFRATGKRPDCLKVYENGRIILKSGPDDDDESGLLMPESEPEEIKRQLSAMGVDTAVKIGTPWQIARAFGMPEISRMEQVKTLPDIKKIVFLSMDSTIV